MKLSRTMRQNLNLVPNEGEGEFFYMSQADPLTKRGLVTVERRTVMVPRVKIYARLTDLGRRVKMQNHED